MKNSPLVTVLLVLLAVISLSAVGICWSYISKSRELRALEGQTATIQNRQNAVRQLEMDVLKYSETNHAIDPILESVGLKRPAAAPAGKPANK